jgi:hypothetical protein
MAIDLHLDVRHKAGSRPLETGWPLHEVQHMLGHANIQQTSTYLNATHQDLHRSMKALDPHGRARRQIAPVAPACNAVANGPTCDDPGDGNGAPTSDSKLLVN